jgi:hypothetical protein
LAAIEARLPPARPDGPPVLASVDDLNELTMLVLRIRDEGSATAAAVNRLVAAARR